MMKTPEEIKKGLELCDGKFLPFYCAECPYNKEKGHCDRDNKEKIKRDALAYIEQLEREKQAYIYDIRNYGFHLCLTCANSKGKYECAKLGTNGLDHTDDSETVIMRCGQYEWRGITEGKGGNVPEPPKEE